MDDAAPAPARSASRTLSQVLWAVASATIPLAGLIWHLVLFSEASERAAHAATVAGVVVALDPQHADRFSYRYNVGGRSIENATRGFGPQREIGARIEVAYDVREPSVTNIRGGFATEAKSALAIAVLCGLAALALIAVNWRKPPQWPGMRARAARK